jgi:hypothetical protein
VSSTSTQNDYLSQVLAPHIEGIVNAFAAITPDVNPTEKCWGNIKQALHRRRRQPTTVVEMEAMVLEE